MEKKKYQINAKKLEISNAFKKCRKLKQPKKQDLPDKRNQNISIDDCKIQLKIKFQKQILPSKI